MSHVLRTNGSHHGDTSVLVGALVAWGVAFLLLWGVLIFFAAAGGAYDPRTTLLMCLPFTLLLVKVIQWWRQGRSRLWVVPFKWAGVGVFWPLWVVAAFSRNFRSSLTPRKPALHCPACGSTVAADASYCTHCGAKLEPE